LSKRATARDIRSDYDFVQRRPTRLDPESAVVTIDGIEVDLNEVSGAVPGPARVGGQRGPASSRGMTKSDFVSRVAFESGLSKKDAGAAVDAVISTIENALKRGEEVSFTGFGKFHVANRGAREGRNPRTGETMTIAASKVPRFTAGSGLKKRVG
jgi:DNA-binding protein HU-beta